MKRYQCHKAVDAAVIEKTGQADDGQILIVAEGEEFSVDRSFVARGWPTPGDYIVRYEDGYLSWSPREPFENGYTLAEGVLASTG